ncbi:Coenzyme F420-reducing hydrogenase, alpha subunit [Thiothrix caldifontis]|uniref:Coenzyme F420-reducing hydrogenase, alpha subunit n=1 Tax=Thiothrix caldifontis TaxID=525918 RepID=A0A1H3ZBE5_9GAMM|nr:Ni/Fe hydrogenase subunit alpha [Thiothrix caldifontis]SEA20935.1 Coenzyme F420-reducing hydrogenase, alpha subunit [Thiothrix caldifontis]
MPESRKLSIRVPILTRVEGEGALELDIDNGAITHLKFSIFEPPRLFEKLLEGRDCQEVPDITARICGICPVAYQMSAVHAAEMAFGVTISPWARDLRRLLYCGEWLQSHALHIHLLAAPDFLGFDSALAMAKIFPHVVKRGLTLQGLGNRLMRVIGGRSVHPVNTCVGGFYAAPPVAEMQALRVELAAAQEEAYELVRWVARLPMPADEQDFVSVALQHPDEYPFNEGRIVSDAGLAIDSADYAQHFEEFQVPHSTALHAHLHGKAYLVGPLARVNVLHEQLPAHLLALLAGSGVQFPSRNMFHSMAARALEIAYCIDEALRLLDSYTLPDQPYVAFTPRESTGFGCTEAPRGMLWHRYDFHADGTVKTARIVPPTSQNQARMEQDLHQSLHAFGLDNDDAALRLRAEQVIRNYDPCISCATHFLRLKVTRT